MKLGQPIAQSAPSYPDETATTYLEIISIASPGTGMHAMGQSVGGIGLTSAGWFAANCPSALPFVLEKEITVYQLGWYNGSAAGDNVDVGIYDTSWVRKVSTGSTTGVGNSTLQFVDVTDTVLPPGRYYMVMARDTTTGNRTMGTPNWTRGGMVLAGVQDSATTAFPLPDPLTNMAEAGTAIVFPWIFIAARVLV